MKKKLKLLTFIFLIFFIFILYSCICPCNNKPVYNIFKGFESNITNLNYNDFSYYKVQSNFDGSECIILNQFDYLFFSKDQGNTWLCSNKVEYEDDFFGCDFAISKDGKYMYITFFNLVYMSSDGGQTWKEILLDNEIDEYREVLITCSQNGQYVYILSDYFLNMSKIYISKDYCKSFETIDINSKEDKKFINYYEFKSLICSDDGKIVWINFDDKFYANYDYLCISNDYGKTWNIIIYIDFNEITDFCISSNGKTAIVAQENSYLLITKDGGISWTELKSAGYREWYSVAMSNDGNIIYAAEDNGYIRISTDGGSTFTDIIAAGIHRFQDLSTSSDGKTLFAITKDKVFLRIDNFGQNITQYNPINLVSP